ncbi:MAG: GNAT family N-acetyltransferase [Novosphingobium sp.]|nr:GNAT family N-acetyltransferase [Novosphingobium sp.]
MTDPQQLWPRSATVAGIAMAIRWMEADDATAVQRFAEAVPLHDLLFLQRDIRQPKVIEAWLQQIASGQIRSLLAVADVEVKGCTAIVRDEFSWSPHVAEIRVLTSPTMRRSGLGRLLAQDSLLAAQEQGVEKVFVRLTPDQGAALTVFEDMGFHPEALLRDHVRDGAGQTHDIAIMALDLNRQSSRHEVFGMGTG